jgi:hypothetical protein
MTAERKKALKPTSKTAWAKSNDAGPHLAVLPSGAVVKFVIPDAAALLRNGRIPNHLREAAVIFTSHPDGTDELMRELVITSALRGPGQDTIANVIQAGRDLANVLVAEMVVEPEITVDDLEAGLLPELDLRMLLEFAERLRNTDAAGNELPITTQETWARFRRQPARVAGVADGNGLGPDDAADVPDADDGVV